MFAPMSVFPQLGAGIPQSQMMLPSTTLAQKSSKTKGKKQTPQHNETHRAGDWVCILCSNLNYSFRKVCNRCQTQTKRDNLLQSLQLLQSPGFAGASLNVGIQNEVYRAPNYACGGLEAHCFQSVMWGLPEGSNSGPSGEDRHLPPGLTMPWSARDTSSRYADSKFGTSQPAAGDEFPALTTTLQPSNSAIDSSANHTTAQKTQKDTLPAKCSVDKQGSSSRESLHSSASTEGSSASNASQQKSKACSSGKPQPGGEQQALYSLFSTATAGRRREGSIDGREPPAAAHKHTIGLLASALDEDEDEQADYVLKACFGGSDPFGASMQDKPQSDPFGPQLVAPDFQSSVSGEMPINAANESTNWTATGGRGQDQPCLPDSSSLEVLRNLDFVLGSE